MPIFVDNYALTSVFWVFPLECFAQKNESLIEISPKRRASAKTKQMLQLVKGALQSLVRYAESERSLVANIGSF